MGQKQPLKEHLLKKARWYNHRNRLHKACLHYLDFLREDPRNLEVVEELGQLYMERGDVDLATLCFQTILKEEPARQDVAIRLARTLFQAGRIAQALLCLQRYDWDEDFLEEALLAQSQCRLSLGFELEALCLMVELTRRYPQPTYFMILAEVLMSQEQYLAAIECTKRGLRREPYSDELLAAQARCYLELEEYDRAKNIYLKMIKNQLPQMEARMDLEDCLVRMGTIPKLQEILKYFDDFAETDF